MVLQRHYVFLHALIMAEIKNWTFPLLCEWQTMHFQTVISLRWCYLCLHIQKHKKGQSRTHCSQSNYLQCVKRYCKCANEQMKIQHCSTRLFSNNSNLLMRYGVNSHFGTCTQFPLISKGIMLHTSREEHPLGRASERLWIDSCLAIPETWMDKIICVPIHL